MAKISKFGIIHFIILSILIHVLLFLICFYGRTKQNFFVQVPFEVSFYSPVENKTKIKVVGKKVVGEKKEVGEERKKKENKKQKITKDDIIVKSKKKIEKKREEVKVKQPKVEQPKAEQTAVKEETSQKISATGSQEVSNSKGVMFENKNFKYSYYTNTIVKKIRKYWQWSQTTEVYRAVVYFRILKDGSIDEVKIKESSKNEEFDQNAVRAVKLSGPFAPLPSGYNENYLGVYFEFKFN